jgi:demethylmenaquinone methyltransferase/2-methoxy-6-polyprenyl-1,4-benzoquinol methylase
VGKEKVSNKHLNDLVTLELGDVRNLSMFKENTFDIVTMSFGIRNVPEKDVALCEIYRVLQKKNKGKKVNDGGGRLAILEFSEPGEESGVLGSIARLFIHYVVPIMGALLSGAPREYLHLQNSIKEFPSPPQFKQLIEASHCGKNKRGSFRVEKIIPMNFDSVHIYIAVPVENR